MNRTRFVAAIATAVCIAASCSDLPTESNDPVVIIRNTRADTIASALVAGCDDAGGFADVLRQRGALISGGEYSFVHPVGCIDLIFRNAKDSVLAQRSLLNLSLGDTVIVVLRK